MKKVISILLVSFSTILLASCVSPHWYKSGVSRKTTHSYYQKCVYNIGMNKLSIEKERMLMRACMEKEGFRWVN